MATFAVPILPVLALEPIPGADFIELAVIADYRSVVKKGTVKSGGLVAYIPENAIVPDWLIDRLGLTGKLAGPEANRVKAIRLKGALSQGLVLPLESAVSNEAAGQRLARPARADDEPACIVDGLCRRQVTPDEDVAAFLGISKYEPPVPLELLGSVVPLVDYALNYDIDDLKRWPDVLVEGEDVVMTEKIHGTLVQIGHVPGLDHPDLLTLGDGAVFVSAKGIAHKGLVFTNAPENDRNAYVRAQRMLTPMLDGLFKAARAVGGHGDAPVIFIGEVFGSASRQDLRYGETDLGVRGFDIHLGAPHHGRFLDDDELDAVLAQAGLPRAPVIYRGPWSRATADALCQGRESVSGKALHIREGLVVRPRWERVDPSLGRVILKHVSPAYLTRKGGTEFS